MKYLFWQNIVSLHQAAFLSALSQKHDVTLIAEKEIASYRLTDGWNIPEMGNVKIIMAPSDSEMEQLLNDNADAVHIITGIDGFKMPYKAFKMATARGLKVMNMLEPYEWAGVKGFLRWAKYSMLQIRYGKKINSILAIGALGEKVYRKAGFKSSKIFQWGYFTKAMGGSGSGIRVHGSGLPKVLFVGRLDENKNSRLLLETMQPMMDKVECLTLVGDGVLHDEIVSQVLGISNAQYLGNQPNNKVHELMQQHDILVLPSNYDGWGAVVNEALQNGMRVIVSENCGANVLVDGKTRGEVFRFKGGQQSLTNTLEQWIKKGPLSPEERQAIKTWAEEHISGEKSAEYFEDITNHIYNGAERPVAPWNK